MKLQTLSRALQVHFNFNFILRLLFKTFSQRQSWFTMWGSFQGTAKGFSDPHTSILCQIRSHAFYFILFYYFSVFSLSTSFIGVQLIYKTGAFLLLRGVMQLHTHTQTHMHSFSDSFQCILVHLILLYFPILKVLLKYNGLTMLQ